MEDINRRSALTLGLAAAAAIRENSPHYEQTMLVRFYFIASDDRTLSMLTTQANRQGLA